MTCEDKSGKMSMEEFNWAYATLQQEVEAWHALALTLAMLTYQHVHGCIGSCRFHMRIGEFKCE